MESGIIAPTPVDDSTVFMKLTKRLCTAGPGFATENACFMHEAHPVPAAQEVALHRFRGITVRIVHTNEDGPSTTIWLPPRSRDTFMVSGDSNSLVLRHFVDTRTEHAPRGLLLLQVPHGTEVAFYHPSAGTTASAEESVSVRDVSRVIPIERAAPA